MGIIYKFFGAILDLVFNGVTLITPVAALGISIILFTFITRLILTPLQLSSQRTSRAMTKLQPEMQRIQNKYKGKTDQQSQLQQSMEMRDLYKRYKIKPLAGCLPLLIQFPLIIALFNVLRQPASYIGKLGTVYQNIASIIVEKVSNYQTLLEPFTQSVSMNANNANFDLSNAQDLSVFLSHLSTADWTQFLSNVDSSTVTVINQALEAKQNFEVFLWMNVVDTPKMLVTSGQWLVLLIPIIAGASTYIFSKITMAANNATANGQAQNSAETMMKTMNVAMPIMTAIFSWTMPIGLALYWISGNIIMMGQQVIVNRILAKQDLKLEEQLRKEREAAGNTVKTTKKKVLKKVLVNNQADTTTKKAENPKNSKNK